MITFLIFFCRSFYPGMITFPSTPKVGISFWSLFVFFWFFLIVWFILFIKILLFAKNQKYSSLHPPQTQRAPHRPNGWYNALRFVLWESTAPWGDAHVRYGWESSAGCHITGPVALRRSLSTGLPILLFSCGILHRNHKTFFFFSITTNHLWQVAQKRQCLYDIFG